MAEVYNPIAFPGLGVEFDPSPVAFTLFGKPFFWYGILIAFGFLLAAIYTLRRSKEFGISKDDFIDVLIFAVPSAIILSRVYYVVFNFQMFKHDLWRAVRLWEGGIAIYGAIIGAVIATVICARVKKINIGALLDLGAPGLLIGQIVGRWGNFINREAHGVQTELPWRMEIYDYEAMTRLSVHPTFLYESLWNLIGFVIIHILSKKRKFDGEVFLIYAAWYGLGRMFIEGLRTDSLYLFNTGIRVSQLLSALALVAAVILLIYKFKTKKYKPLYVLNPDNSFERDIKKKQRKKPEITEETAVNPVSEASAEITGEEKNTEENDGVD